MQFGPKELDAREVFELRLALSLRQQALQAMVVLKGQRIDESELYAATSCVEIALLQGDLDETQDRLDVIDWLLSFVNVAPLF